MGLFSRRKIPAGLPRDVTFLWLSGRLPISGDPNLPGWSKSYGGLLPWVAYWWDTGAAQVQELLQNPLFVFEVRRWWVWMHKLRDIRGKFPVPVETVTPPDMLRRIKELLPKLTEAGEAEAAAATRARDGARRTERWSALRYQGEQRGAHFYGFAAGPTPRPRLWVLLAGPAVQHGVMVGIDADAWMQAALFPLESPRETRSILLPSGITLEEDCTAALQKAYENDWHVYTQHIHLDGRLHGHGIGAATFLAMWDVVQRADSQAAFITGGCHTKSSTGAYYLWKHLLQHPLVEDLSCEGLDTAPMVRLRGQIPRG